MNFTASNGKTYRVAPSSSATNVHYNAIRNGKLFGRTRVASVNSKPGTVGAEIWTAITKEYGDGDGFWVSVYYA